MLLNLKSVPDYKFVIGNLLLLLLLLLDMVLEIWVCVDQGKGFVKGLLSAVGLGAVFAVSYFMAGVAGLFYFFILIVVILVKSLLESIPEVAGIAAGAAIPSAEELNRKVKPVSFAVIIITLPEHAFLITRKEIQTTRLLIIV